MTALVEKYVRVDVTGSGPCEKCGFSPTLARCLDIEAGGSQIHLICAKCRASTAIEAKYPHKVELSRNLGNSTLKYRRSLWGGMSRNPFRRVPVNGTEHDIWLTDECWNEVNS